MIKYPINRMLGPRPLFLACVFLAVAIVIGWLDYMVLTNVMGFARWFLGVPLSLLVSWCLYCSVRSFLDEAVNGYLWKVR